MIVKVAYPDFVYDRGYATLSRKQPSSSLASGRLQQHSTVMTQSNKTHFHPIEYKLQRQLRRTTPLHSNLGAERAEVHERRACAANRVSSI